MDVVRTYFRAGNTTALFFLGAGWDAAGWGATGHLAGLGATDAARGATEAARLGATDAARIATDTGYPSGKATPAAARAASASRHPLFFRPPGFRPSALFFRISAILKQRVVQ